MAFDPAVSVPARAPPVHLRVRCVRLQVPELELHDHLVSGDLAEVHCRAALDGVGGGLGDGLDPDEC